MEVRVTPIAALIGLGFLGYGLAGAIGAGVALILPLASILAAQGIALVRELWLSQLEAWDKRTVRHRYYLWRQRKALLRERRAHQRQRRKDDERDYLAFRAKRRDE